MIINIPINIDEHIFEEKVQNEYDKIITNEIIKRVEEALLAQDQRYYTNRSSKTGMEQLVNAKVDNYIKEYKDEIIAQAADILAKRVQRTKKAKEELNGEDNS